MDRLGANSPSKRVIEGSQRRQSQAYFGRERLESKLSATSTNYSIQSSTTPFYKNGHSMTKKPGPVAFLNKMSTFENDPDLEKRGLRLGGAQLQESKTQRNIDQPKLESNFTLQIKSLKSGIQVADASTQVFTRNQNVKHRISNFNHHSQCEFIGCTELADGGQCDYRVCWSKGCNRSICAQHMVQPDEDVEDDAFKNRVCVECEGRANRAFWLAILLLFVVLAMTVLPAVLLYGGDQH